jgi:1-deoxy-D-xylulose-5-phosphate reductoisomerase
MRGLGQHPRRVCVLGATGSVGVQACDVLARFPEVYVVDTLTGYRNVDALVALALRFCPQRVVVKDDTARQAFLDAWPMEKSCPEILIGEEGLCEVSAHPDVDTVINAIVGFAGLKPTFAALNAGKQLLTGNKETIVTAGHLLKPYLKQILPLDSEHNAIFQCLESCHNRLDEVRKVYLTASGGPFLTRSLESFHTITPEEALKHPCWSMGERITIDSATMMNKAFERIEAEVLFDLPPEKVDIVIHPQSMVHSAVAYVDGSILAQMGSTDMRLPILYALAYPERWPLTDPACHVDLPTLGRLDFEPVEWTRFPCLGLAEAASGMGGTALTILNAADELAVAAFLRGELTWLDIPRVIEAALEAHRSECEASPDIETLCAVDAAYREGSKLQHFSELTPVTA